MMQMRQTVARVHLRQLVLAIIPLTVFCTLFIESRDNSSVRDTGAPAVDIRRRQQRCRFSMSELEVVHVGRWTQAASGEAGPASVRLCG